MLFIWSVITCSHKITHTFCKQAWGLSSQQSYLFSDGEPKQSEQFLERSFSSLCQVVSCTISEVLISPVDWTAVWSVSRVNKATRLVLGTASSAPGTGRKAFLCLPRTAQTSAKASLTPTGGLGEAEHGSWHAALPAAFPSRCPLPAHPLHTLCHPHFLTSGNLWLCFVFCCFPGELEEHHITPLWWREEGPSPCSSKTGDVSTGTTGTQGTTGGLGESQMHRVRHKMRKWILR